MLYVIHTHVTMCCEFISLNLANGFISVPDFIAPEIISYFAVVTGNWTESFQLKLVSINAQQYKLIDILLLIPQSNFNFLEITLSSSIYFGAYFNQFLSRIV